MNYFFIKTQEPLFQTLNLLLRMGRQATNLSMARITILFRKLKNLLFQLFQILIPNYLMRLILSNRIPKKLKKYNSLSL
jgi:hypothetical protein